MSKFSEYIGSQFGNPHGFVGKCCCFIMNIINSPMYKAVVKVFENKMKTDEAAKEQEQNVLDIGYGNGYLLNRIYKKNKIKLFGIDISEDMKMAAEQRNQKALKNEDLFLGVGDVCNLPFSDNTFDFVSSINTVYFWQNVESGMKQIYRVLKNDGIFCNVVYSKKWLQKLSYTRKGFAFFEKEDFISLGKRANFSHTEIKDIVKGKSFLVILKKWVGRCISLWY